MNQQHQQNRREIEAARRANLSRRRFLQGVGACIALPALESLISPRLLAAAETSVTGAAGGTVAATTTGAPMRMAFVYFPNGAIPAQWWPEGDGGTDFKLPRTLQPLESVRQHIQVMQGLDHKNATPGPDGAGDHARAGGTFLTGVRVKKTAGADIHAGVSIDQLVAQKVGHLTRFPSLELSCDAIRKSGNCDSGYSCAYQYNMSWSSATTPVAPESNPRQVFERLFGAGSQGERRQNFKARQAQQKSILDFVREDAGSLNSQLGARDKQKLDEYLTSVRAIERRIEEAERFGETPDPSVDTPPGVPASYQEHIRLMYDMMLLAFQTDSTRVATFLMANDGSNRAFPEINIPEGHHFLTHHQGKKDMIDKVAEIDRFYVQQFAWFLEKMSRTKDLDGNPLLHNTMIVYGSGNADGNRHTHVNLPVILAGGHGADFTPGRYVKAGGQPLCNLFLTMADRMGVKNVERFGDSTEPLKLVKA